MTPSPRLPSATADFRGRPDAPGGERRPEASGADRRRMPSAFRGSLERRLPGAPLAAEPWPLLLPPDCRSEAFAEDLLDEGAAAA